MIGERCPHYENSSKILIPASFVTTDKVLLLNMTHITQAPSMSSSIPQVRNSDSS